MDETVGLDNCAYRVDGYAPGSSRPYRARVGGAVVRDTGGGPRKFSTLMQACEFVLARNFRKNLTLRSS